jgi:hypothetical protein
MPLLLLKIVLDVTASHPRCSSVLLNFICLLNVHISWDGKLKEVKIAAQSEILKDHHKDVKHVKFHQSELTISRLILSMRFLNCRLYIYV